MRLADMHIHTTFSPDGKSSMEEQCIKAIEIGIPIICFTDHVDFNSSEINVGRIINKASTNFDVSEYFYEVNRLRRIYNSIQILIGIEFSEPHLFPTEFEDYSSMPFDYILGSIHHCYGSVFPGAKNIEESKAIDEYYNLMLKSIQTCEFQAMAHIDFPRRYFDNWNVSDKVTDLIKYLEISKATIYNYRNLENFSDIPKDKQYKIFYLFGKESEEELELVLDEADPDILAQYVNRISSILKESIQSKKQSLSSIEDLTSELERLQGENEALKQQVAAGQALNGLDPFTKSVIIDKVAAIVNGTSAAEIKEFLDYIDIFDKYRKFTKGE